MDQRKFFALLRQSLAQPLRPFDSKRRPRGVFVQPQLETLEDRVVPSDVPISLPLQNETGLDPNQYSVYVFGYSQAGNGIAAQDLQVNGGIGEFAQISGSGSLPIYNLTSGSINSISLESDKPVNSGIVYFLVEPNGAPTPTITYSPGGNGSMNFSGLPDNPPDNPWPYAIVEITEPGDSTDYPVIDDSVVTGFGLPVSVTLNGNLGQIGQSLTDPAVSRQSILDAYTTFMNAQGKAGDPYKELLYGSIDGQAVGLSSPDKYLASLTDWSKDALATLWDNTVAELYGGTVDGTTYPGMTLSMFGVDSGNGVTDYYVGTPKTVTFGGQTYNVLDFVGYDYPDSNPSQVTANGNEFWLFSPLTPNPNGTSYKAGESPGEMVFGGDSVFNDESSGSNPDAPHVIQTQKQQANTGNTPAQTVLALENDVNEALNRGVALASPAQTGTGPGANSVFWANESNWYPAGKTENLYSLFMHTATINGTPIFTLPSATQAPSNTAPAIDAQGMPMSQSYGFAFDETPAPYSPSYKPPNVPSKFEPAPAGTTTATITLGPWVEPLPSPHPSPSPSPAAGSSPSSSGYPALLFLAEDKFALEVDSMASMFSNNPLFTQAADRAMSTYNDLFHLYNPALFTGLSGLQSAIFANPLYGTMWEMVGQGAGMDWAIHPQEWGPWTQAVGHVIDPILVVEMFDPSNHS